MLKLTLLIAFVFFIALTRSDEICETRADLMLVLDGSGSISGPDWTKVQNFAKNLVKAFTIGPNDARFGAVQFSTTKTSRLEFGLSDNKNSILSAINNMRKIGKRTDIAKGIAIAREEFRAHGRPGVAKLMIVMTDGKQNENGNPVNQGNQAKAEDIEIFTIGVTSAIDDSMLKKIASQPLNTHKFNVANFDKLQDILQQLINETCIKVDCALVDPDHGPATGGTVVTVKYEGTHPKIAACKFGDVVVQATVSNGYITCKTPPGVGGTSVPLTISLDNVYTNEQCQFTYDVIGEDPCAQWDDNCTFCISHAFCGWCSNEVTNLDGSKGSQCAGFNHEDQTIETDWTCEGTYHTKECTRGWECDIKNAQCVEAEPGNGVPSKSECEETCGLGHVYSCNNQTHKCERCEVALPNCYAFPVCSQFCYVTPTPDPDDEVIDGTPSEILGIWRGLEIGENFMRGEWDAKFDEKTVVIKDPTGSITEGRVSHTDTQILINVTKSDTYPVGSVVRTIYLQSFIAVFKVMTVASGLPNGPAPDSFDSPMKSHEFGNVMVWISCMNTAVCSFRWDDIMAEYAKRTTIVDYCTQFKDCDSCVSQTTCGWCSNHVSYDDGTEGLHCAGFNPDSTKQPFVCSGIFSTHTCNAPPAPTVYECDEKNKKCIPTEPGMGTLWDYCNATCGRVLPPPANFTPSALIGNWRSLEVELNYPRGEFNFLFSKSTLVVTDEADNVIMAGDVGNVEDQIWIYDSRGTYKAKLQLTFGPETKYLTLAFGAVGQDAPKDFVGPMNAPGQTEFFLVSCLDEKKGICDFN